MNKIEIGICEWALPIKFQGACCSKFAADFNLQGVELELGSYSNGFPLSNEYVQAAYLEEKEKYKIQFTSIAVNSLCNYGMTYPPSPDAKVIAKLSVDKAIATAARMGIPLVQIPSFLSNDIKTVNDINATSELLEHACRAAEDKGICIGTENALSNEENLRLLEIVGCENLKVYFDTQNPFAMKGYQVPEMVSGLIDLICEVHIKDGRNKVLSSALIGEGENRVLETIKQLISSGYQGWFILENYYDRQPLSEQNDDPYELLKKDMEILESCINAQQKTDSFIVYKKAHENEEADK